MYLTVTEKNITCGVGICGEAMPEKIISIHRMFQLNLSTGYKSISSDALHAINGINTSHLTNLWEFNLSHITNLNNNLITEQHFPNTLMQQKTPSWQLQPSQNISHF